MNKIDLIKAVAEQVELTQKEVTAVFDAAIELVTKTLKKGEEVSVAGLGKFVVKNRAARQSMNPRTKELIKVPASKAPTFRAAKALKDAVNK
jgi:DNA-binding protein HU-beta